MTDLSSAALGRIENRVRRAYLRGRLRMALQTLVVGGLILGTYLWYGFGGWPVAVAMLFVPLAIWLRWRGGVGGDAFHHGLWVALVGVVWIGGAHGSDLLVELPRFLQSRATAVVAMGIASGWLAWRTPRMNMRALGWSMVPLIGTTWVLGWSMLVFEQDIWFVPMFYGATMLGGGVGLAARRSTLARSLVGRLHPLWVLLALPVAVNVGVKAVQHVNSLQPLVVVAVLDDTHENLVESVEVDGITVRPGTPIEQTLDRSFTIDGKRITLPNNVVTRVAPLPQHLQTSYVNHPSATLFAGLSGTVALRQLTFGEPLDILGRDRDRRLLVFENEQVVGFVETNRLERKLYAHDARRAIRLAATLKQPDALRKAVDVTCAKPEWATQPRLKPFCEWRGRDNPGAQSKIAPERNFGTVPTTFGLAYVGTLFLDVNGRRWRWGDQLTVVAQGRSAPGHVKVRGKDGLAGEVPSTALMTESLVDLAPRKLLRELGRPYQHELIARMVLRLDALALERESIVDLAMRASPQLVWALATDTSPTFVDDL